MQQYCLDNIKHTCTLTIFSLSDRIEDFEDDEIAAASTGDLNKQQTIM